MFIHTYVGLECHNTAFALFIPLYLIFLFSKLNSASRSADFSTEIFTFDWLLIKMQINHLIAFTMEYRIIAWFLILQVYLIL